MHVFYTPDIQISNELPEEEAQHCIRVLRLSIGDEITLTDGKGNFYKAEITVATNKRCFVNIKETIFQEPLWPCHLHIAMAPTKNMDRNEWFAEKATEIGFDELTFLNCRFSERKVIKTERIEKILAEQLTDLAQLDHVADVRVLGAIGVVELTSNVDMKTLQQQFVERGIWVRPFGKLVYVMPPYVITDDELHYLLAQMSEVVKNMQGANANVLA